MDQVVLNIHLSNSKGHRSNVDEAAKLDNCRLLQSRGDKPLNDIKIVLIRIQGCSLGSENGIATYKYLNKNSST